MGSAVMRFRSLRLDAAPLAMAGKERRQVQPARLAVQWCMPSFPCGDLWPSMRSVGQPGATGMPQSVTTDIFSYGPSGSAPDYHTGLSFSNLLIDLDFPLNNPTLSSFVFDPSGMAFDPGQSVSRAGAMVQKLPLEITGLLSGDINSPITSKGYMPHRGDFERATGDQPRWCMERVVI